MTREELIEVMAKALCLWGHRATRWEHYKPEAVEVLVALEAAGVRLVPVEATKQMTDVGTEARWQSAVRDANNVREIWRAMLAASPYALKETGQ